ncbi:hypothetical protein [Aeromicrobium sp. Leaf291]|uniref:hypothetical protein n=1 Tax=Aeromicrobium sp. Leaf291 TaxID=1736325 RepID=UPI0006F6225D|nr:hypothetical protein [Aeromicrobium sp. Leaf291]KQP81590.1 hypothetical protein ASF35_16295 [Aeromicrobium sp. Leaf291]
MTSTETALARAASFNSRAFGIAARDAGGRAAAAFANGDPSDAELVLLDVRRGLLAAMPQLVAFRDYHLRGIIHPGVADRATELRESIEARRAGIEEALLAIACAARGLNRHGLAPCDHAALIDILER